MQNHLVELYPEVDNSIDVVDLPIGGFGRIVNTKIYYGQILTRIWAPNNQTHVFTLNNPIQTWSNLDRGVFRVIPITPGTDITISVVETDKLNPDNR